MKEPRSPRFLSDSTIHRLTGPSPLDPDTVSRSPSIHTLRKQLTREGGSLHHILLLLNGNKVRTRSEELHIQESRADQQRAGGQRVQQQMSCYGYQFVFHSLFYFSH